MTMENKIQLIEEMMDLEEGELTPDTVLEEVTEYDSFFKLYLVTYVKKSMDRRLTVAEIEKFKTVQDICDYLE
ncbi:MAG: acyl carrier protein [Ruminococcus flavefaciens]|nr:acyl carrier protein [Ruminococcus flavefaciens]